MKIISSPFEFSSACPSKAILLFDNVEDLWHLYNIVWKGDFMKTTFSVRRRVKFEVKLLPKKINIIIKE
jgi:stalled ribosome rescue protein Dom34